VGGQGLGGAAEHPCGGADEKVGSRRESECGRDVEVAGEVFHEWDGDRGAGVCGKNCLSGIEEGLERSGRVERGRSGGVKEGSARRGT